MSTQSLNATSDPPHQQCWIMSRHTELSVPVIYIWVQDKRSKFIMWHTHTLQAPSESLRLMPPTSLPPPLLLKGAGQYRK